MNTKRITMKEMRSFFIGKTVSYHDGWSGAHRFFVIHKVENRGDSVMLKTRLGAGWVIVSKKDYPTLLKDGEVTYHGEVEGCGFDITTRIMETR